MNHIAVVGAGTAGLGAALALQDAGLSCTVYEAFQRIGDFATGDETLDNKGIADKGIV
jgi:monoamine oxidase